MSLLQANLQRIQDTLTELSSFNATPEEKYTRFSYSEEDRKAREFITTEMERCGMTVNTDAVGNIRGRLDGANPDKPVIMSGSHIDTVRCGGNLDGALGVIAALEVARIVKEQSLQLGCPYEMIVFAEEEGSNFGVTTLGSKCLAGQCDIDYLKQLKNTDGDSSYDVLKDFGLNPDRLEDDVLKKGEAMAMLELHIEQSVVLENKGINIGVVDEVAGRKAYWVNMEGAAGHAGATPMGQRKDALVGTAEIIAAIEDLVTESGGPRSVATVGRIECAPNVTNSIPGKVKFSLDIRDVQEARMESIASRIRQELEMVAKKHHLEFDMQLAGASDGMPLSMRVAETIDQTAKDSGLTTLAMTSGAVHDCAILGHLTEVGLIFIPSVDGLSHVSEEYSTPEDIHAGSSLLLNTVLRLSQSA